MWAEMPIYSQKNVKWSLMNNFLVFHLISAEQARNSSVNPGLLLVYLVNIRFTYNFLREIYTHQNGMKVPKTACSLSLQQPNVSLKTVQRFVCCKLIINRLRKNQENAMEILI